MPCFTRGTLGSKFLQEPSGSEEFCSSFLAHERRAASAIALKAYSSYTHGPIDLILGRKHRGNQK